MWGPSHSLWMDTMNRCITSAAARPASGLPGSSVGRLGLLSLALLAGSPVLAQSDTVRPFPEHALRGELVVTQPPLVTLDGVEARLSPGARILDTQNRVVPPSKVMNQTLTVNYTRELLGLVHEVWILRPQEAALKRKRAGE